MVFPFCYILQNTFLLHFAIAIAKYMLHYLFGTKKFISVFKVLHRQRGFLFCFCFCFFFCQQCLCKIRSLTAILELTRNKELATWPQKTKERKDMRLSNLLHDCSAFANVSPCLCVILPTDRPRGRLVVPWRCCLIHVLWPKSFGFKFHLIFC